MRSEAQVARLLRLVPYLSAHQGVTVAETAEVFATSPRQIIKDLEVLQFCGLPGGLYDDLFDVDIEGAREDGHIFFRNADVLARPLRLRPAEAAGLLAALRVVIEVAQEEETSAARSALARLESAVGTGGGRLTVAVASGDPGHRTLLTGAIAGRKVVHVRYRTPGRPGVSEAEVEPARLHVAGGYTYLDAWSRPREAWRTFRLDRIEGVEPADGSAGDHGEPPTGWFEDAPTKLTVRVTPDARWIAEYYPTHSVSDVDGAVDIAFPVASSDWAVSLLLRLGGRVLAVSDEAIRDAARARAREALELYGEPPSTVG